MAERKVAHPATKVSSKATTVSAWEQDPGTGAQPDGGQILQRPIPKLNATPFPLVIQHPTKAPVAKVYSSGTSEFRYWAGAEALRRGADFWGSLLPGASWEVGDHLPIDLDHGVDLNAYYDRVGLRFFHGTAGRRTVYSGESPDIVCHELGHAILDSIKPQLWDAASIEVAAFHESFGDMSAILSNLQLSSLRHAVIEETGGMLYRVSRLSRLAEQLGWAIRQSYPTAVEPDCLRNAVNAFFYRNPDTLPTSAPASALSSEPHSFSRVFTGAFFEGLAGMWKARPAQDEPNLLQVSQDMGRILVDAIQHAAVVPAFFSQVAANMLSIADAQFKTSGYSRALKSAFVRHGVISPTAGVALAEPPAQAAAAVAPVEQELAKLAVSVAEYGLGFDSIVVHAATEPMRFNVAGAALAIGAVTSPSPEEAAKSFVEDLIRRGRLKISGVADQHAEIVRASAPATHETNTHELRREGGDIVLRRVRIDCGFHAEEDL